MPPPERDKSTEHLPDFLPAQDWVGMLVGPPRSGKSHTINNLILRRELYGGVYTVVHLFSPTARNDPSMAHLLASAGVVHHPKYSDEIIEAICADQLEAKKEALAHGDRPPRCLIVADDMIGELGRDSALASLATRYRHYNISILISTQTFREVSLLIRSNVSWLIIYPMSSVREIHKLADEYEGSAPGIAKAIAALVKTRREFLYVVPGHSMRVGFSADRVLWRDTD